VTAQAVQPEGPAIRLGASACLLGELVRFDGGHKQDRFLLHTLGQYVQWVPVCPEVAIGLGTPRPSIRLEGRAADPRLVEPTSGADLTERMRTWSRKQVEELAAADLHGYVLKKNSPSCGLFRVRVYGKGGVPTKDGRGIFADELVKGLALLPVEEEGRLSDPRLRENFIERMFAYQRLRSMLRDHATPKGLVAFHTRHKFALLAHDPERYRALGRLVADAGSRPWEELSTEYAKGFMECLATMATPGRHVNVLQHVAGHLKEHVDAGDRAELVDVFDRYGRGLVPLIVPLTLLRHHLRKHPVGDWAREQVYLNPYPRELMLRNHV
jgi:uncharacterized protein YbgA (DUF1722 family)/uncharacterized protein YbbK (DUF523 family)